MDEASQGELIDRLVAEDGPPDAVADIVLAAADGEESLASHLGGAPAPAAERTVVEPAPPPPRVYLDEIAVTGFRGIAEQARLQLRPGPGLTLVVGRNGSGKSSFAEGLELLLTGTSVRWDGMPKPWREGWRCLHGDDKVELEAAFRVDGEQALLRVSQTWAEGDALDGGPGRVVSGPIADWQALGWTGPLEQYRPLLSYSEMSAMFSSRASELYDALSSVLGLEAFERLQATLRSARLARADTDKQERAQRRALRSTLDGVDDERARQVFQQLPKRPPDLDVVQEVVTGSKDSEDIAPLEAIAALVVPSADEIHGRHGRCAETRRVVAEQEATDAERLSLLAGVLDGALRLHADHGEQDCPVCRTPGVLDEGWARRAQAELDDGRRRSSDLREARATATQARNSVEALFDARVIPAALRRSGFLDSEQALAAWDAWSADRLDVDAARVLGEALHELRQRATSAIAQHDAAWRAVEEPVLAWLAMARRAVEDRQLVERLREAEEWVKTTVAALRSERLAPVVDRAQANWEQLRHESNVHLGKVELVQSGNQRIASFDVTVDGAEGSAHGVMSQGELSALAVSVFLPRAALPDSPFGFVVIDDPVQSMDPAKVDGLARVLAEAAEERQVIVFTHDERLPQAVERLALPASVIEVKRRAESKVELIAGSPPSERHLREARALNLTDELPAEVRARVIPGFCRAALEAACATAIRRRRLAAGDRHALVEEDIAKLTRLVTWLAAAFDIPVNQPGDIYARVRSLAGTPAESAVRIANRGSHERLDFDVDELLRGTSRLVERIEAP